MAKKTIPLTTRLKKLINKDNLPAIGGVIVLIIFVLLAISSVVLQKYLRESQDWRQQASVADGTTLFNVSPESGTTFPTNTPASLTLLLNTQGLGDNEDDYRINGLQLAFELTTDIADFQPNNFSFEPTGNLDLFLAAYNTEDLGNNHYRIELIFLPEKPNPDEPPPPVSTNDFEPFFRLNFTTPNNEGTIWLTPSRENSIATRYDTTIDILKHIDEMVFYINDEAVNCQDSDGGRNFNLVGNTTGPISSVVETDHLSHCATNDSGTYGSCDDYCFYDDSWAGSGENIHEWFCNESGEVSYDRRGCDLGCNNGACIQETDSTCGAPENMRLTETNCHADNSLSFTLDWNDYPGANRYLLELSPNADYSDAVTYYPIDSQWSIHEVTSGTWYARVRVAQNDNCVPDESWATYSFTQECEAQTECQYDFGNWNNECIDGWQERNYNTNDPNCPEPAWELWHRTCAEQCVYEYSDWSECVNGWQEREVISTSPEGCYPYVQADTLHYCGSETPAELNLFIYNYENCWYGNSDGASTYIIWNEAGFSNATWVDISLTPDFNNFAHKELAQSNLAQYDGYWITDGQDFRWAADNSQFSFAPNTVYYIRLYNGTHSQVASFYMPQCSVTNPGVGGENPQLCNESCNSNADCAANLRCYQGQCRLATNPESEQCTLPVTNGINRSCNEYCADTSECAPGYTCWWNRCRNPENLEDAACRARSQTVYVYRYLYTPAPGSSSSTTKGGVNTTDAPLTVKGCNESCATNRDCAPNMRCYNYQCRLAINPESTYCDPDEVVGGKGATAATDQTDSQLRPSQTVSPTSSQVSPPPMYEAEDNELDADKPLAEQTALDALKEYLADRGIPLQWLLMVGGVSFFILLLLLFLLRRRNDDDEPPTYQRTTYQPGSAGRPTSTTRSTRADQPQAGQTRATARSTTPAKQHNKFGTPIGGPPPSSMTQKLKEKNVKPPGK
ncbi:MAG: hypothetical protein GF390_04135 [Candidatus Pacebacteria bacterium]|nr:hypothetical protein [Candidatus Paceibacterota bacterium]